MNLNSVPYMLFFLLVCLGYFVVPKKLQNIFLLIASYYFYIRWNAGYAVLLFSVTLLTYLSGILMERFRAGQRENSKKTCLVLTIACALGLLVYFKYANFIITNLNILGSILKTGRTISLLDIVLPVGISFYLFQAMGYVIDVYRGEAAAEHNPVRYALFVSFFPQLLSGPIGRANSLMGQFSRENRLTSDNLRAGLLSILIGLWMKIVVADNLAVTVNTVLLDHEAYNGVQIAIATMLFGIQLYCDFGGYSYIAIGSARILGIRLMQNFNSPYLAVSVTDFWRRWHISLTSWFRDYLYIPLGGNRKGKARQYINIMIVFLISGLWHGASWTFVLWGGLNGLMLLFERITKMDRKPVTAADIWFRRAVTFLLISITWFFFQAATLGDAYAIIRHSLSDPGIKSLLSGSAFYAFGDARELSRMVISLLCVFVLDLVRERSKGDLIHTVLRQKACYRWAFYILMVFAIILWGAYGDQYVQTAFVYFQF